MVENERLVFTDAYTEAWQPSQKPFMTLIVTFENEDGKTHTPRWCAIGRPAKPTRRWASTTAGAGQRTSSRSSARNSDSRNAQLGCFGVEVCQLPEEEARPCERCTDPAMDFSNVAADEFTIGTTPSTFPNGSACPAP